MNYDFAEWVLVRSYVTEWLVPRRQCRSEADMTAGTDIFALYREFTNVIDGSPCGKCRQPSAPWSSCEGARCR